MKTKLLSAFFLIINYQLSIITCSSQNMAGGGLHSMVLCSNSTVMATGYNLNGQLGVGDTTYRLIPVQVHGPGNVGFLTGITMLATGGNPLEGVSHSLALKNDGTVWSWGWNHYGQLGIGDTISKTTPVQVSNLTGIISIAGGGYHSYALKNDGTVWAWGRNNHGQLGKGDTIGSTIPVQVNLLTGITAIAGGGWGHSYALKNDSTVWSWGQNYYGQLGLGDTTDRTSPEQIIGLTDITAISSGGGHSLSLKNNGTVWVWGYNGFGQLGDSTTIERHTPVQVDSLTGIIAIAGGAGHSLALKSDGTVWAWGFNQLGQLGDGTNVNKITPVQVSLITGISDISGGGGHSLALKNDGTVWGWGYNDFGALGDSTNIQRDTPVQMIGLCYVNGISQLSTLNSQLSIYPNPSSGKFTIQMDTEQFSIVNYQLSIINVMGEKVVTRSVIPSGASLSAGQDGNLSIDLSDVQNGMYFLQIKTEQGTALRKIIISK